MLWDLDGTLIDSEPYWMAEETLLVEQFGGTWTHEEALQLVGAGLELSAEVLQNAGVPWETQTIIDHLTDGVMSRIRERTPWRPGARELLAELRRAQVPTALVTMSIRRMAELVADAVSEIDGNQAFDVIVSGSDVRNAKPHPEAYMSAASQLGVDPVDCVAIEDSPTGLTSAVASGARVVGVPLMISLPQPSVHFRGWVLWETLEGRTLDDLAEVLRAARAADAIAPVDSPSDSGPDSGSDSDSGSVPSDGQVLRP